jgi:hypothetical protein
VNGLTAAMRRAAELLVEPLPAAAPAAQSLDVVVTALTDGAGASTVARGLAIALRRRRPVELTVAQDGSAAVAPGPGTAVIRDASAAAMRTTHHQETGRVLVAVADARREPAVALLVRDVLAQRHERVVVVGNRARDAAAWGACGAVVVPDARLGAVLVARGRRPPGSMGAAFEALALRVDAT